jgi:hypothetical protein
LVKTPKLAGTFYLAWARERRKSLTANILHRIPYFCRCLDLGCSPP